MYSILLIICIVPSVSAGKSYWEGKVGEQRASWEVEKRIFLADVSFFDVCQMRPKEEEEEEEEEERKVKKDSEKARVEPVVGGM